MANMVRDGAGQLLDRGLSPNLFFLIGPDDIFSFVCEKGICLKEAQPKHFFLMI